jgi:hypothetical protein
MGIRKIIGWLFVFIVGSLIVTFLISPNSFNNFKQNVKRIIPSPISGNAIQQNNVNNTPQNNNIVNKVPKENPLLTKCESSFNSCKDITEQKYDTSISLLKIAVFQDESSATDFFNTWKGIMQVDLETSTMSYIRKSNIQYPIVLIAIVSNTQNGQFPAVVACDSEGNLFDYSKTVLLCG